MTSARRSHSASSTVTSFEKLDQALDEAQEALRVRAEEAGIARTPEPELWFRGVPRRDFALVPTLFRQPRDLGVEPDLYESYVEHRPHVQDWHALFEMQHHFLPTRLLDWSSSWGIALYFALQSDQALEQPTLWILHPGLLNKLSLRGDQWQRLPRSGTVDLKTLKDLDLDYRTAYLRKNDGGSSYPRSPIAISPGAVFPRLEAQRGRFTIHGSDTRALEDQCGRAVEKIVIDSGDSKIETMQKVAMGGMDPFRLFPDPVGLAHYLGQRFDLDHVVRVRPLRTHLRTLWRDDAVALQSSEGPAAQVRTPGIENCRVLDAYVDRNLNAAQSFFEWIVGESQGGIRVIAGDAGSGKTNFLLNLLVKHKVYERQAVIWFPLFGFEPDSSLLENVSRHLKSMLGQKGVDLNVAVSELLKRRDTILVLDGLDELSRTKGSETAIKLIKLLERMSVESIDIPKVLLTCRDDILGRLNRTGDLSHVLGPSGTPQILLKPISAAELAAHKATAGLEPEIQLLVGQYPIFLRLPAIDPRARTSTQLFQSAFEGRTERGQAKLELLGRLAQTMLLKRQDFLDAESFARLPGDETLFNQSPLQPLIRERSTGNVRFFHHTIREFVLGWNVHASLTQMPARWNLLRETSDLDYEGFEIFRVVSELGDVPDWSTVRMHCEGQDPSDWARYNNYAWNCFEAAGMLGAPEQRQVVLNWIYDVLDRRVDGRDRSYSFKVKYNAARALERLHSEGHLRHWQWIRDYSRLKNPERYLVHGWAVRGFQRKELGFGHRPPIHVASRASRDEEQGRFSRLLIQKIHELSEFAELSQDASYLLVNLTHALIRWYEPSEVDDKRLSRLANDNSYLNDHAKQNLDLALWWWCHKRRKKVVVERTTDKRRRITHIGQHARSAS